MVGGDAGLGAGPGEQGDEHGPARPGSRSPRGPARTSGRGLRTDLLAGFTLWGLLVPEMIAYAGLAGLPPQAGLYTLLASLVAYAVLGTSRQLVVAGTSASAVLVYAAVHELHPADAAQQATLAAAVIVLTGIVFLIAGAAKLGFLASFLSRPVMTGFVFGLALFVAVRQLPKVLGIEGGEGNSVEQLAHVLRHLGDLDPATLVVGLGALALLVVLGERAAGAGRPGGPRRRDRHQHAARPRGARRGRRGADPRGLPSPALPQASLADLWILLPSAVGMMLVIYSEALGAAAAFAEAHGDRIDPDQELVALGVANVGSGLLGGLAAGGACRSRRSTTAPGALPGVDPVRRRPRPDHHHRPHRAVRAAARGRARRPDPPRRGPPHEGRRAPAHRPAEPSGVRPGRDDAGRGARPRRAARPDPRRGGVDRAGHRSGQPAGGLGAGRRPRPSGRLPRPPPPPRRDPVPGLHLVRPDAPIFYANAQAICDAITEATGGAEPPIATVVLDLDGSDALDITSTEHLVTTAARSIGRASPWRWPTSTPARRTADALGLTDAVGADRIHPTVHDAVLAHRRTEAP
ncbi:MAG: SulP family inorganic anion transporter [Acidimicrobiales bacterium]